MYVCSSKIEKLLTYRRKNEKLTTVASCKYHTQSQARSMSNKTNYTFKIDLKYRQQYDILCCEWYELINVLYLLNK